MSSGDISGLPSMTMTFVVSARLCRRMLSIAWCSCSVSMQGITMVSQSVVADFRGLSKSPGFVTTIIRLEGIAVFSLCALPWSGVVSQIWEGHNALMPGRSLVSCCAVICEQSTRFSVLVDWREKSHMARLNAKLLPVTKVCLPAISGVCRCTSTYVNSDPSRYRSCPPTLKSATFLQK